jgi:hypothetical protein
MKYYGLVMMSVTEFVVTVVALLFAGRFIDGHYSTGSRWMTIGTISGFTIGIIRMTLRLRRIMDNSGDS